MVKEPTTKGNARAPKPIDVKIGGLIRKRRREIDMSQERLAKILGVTFQQVQKYENGTNRIAASTLFFVAKALGVPIGHFFEDGTAKKE